MSSFKNFAPTLRSLQAQADGTGTIAGSPLEDFLSIAGYETPGGGGGGSSELTVTVQTLNIPQTTLTGVESDGWYSATAEVGTMSQDFIDGIPYNDSYKYTILSDESIFNIDGVDVLIDTDFENGKFILNASAESAFTITYPATVITYFRATKDVADVFGIMPVIEDNGG